MSEKIATGQTPSKVLHIRNLPYETTQEELEDLSRNFGTLVKTKLNVGANRNQAFIEFPDVQSAVNMVHHFMSSAEPAKVRGKTVYLQYSTRQEIVNATSSAEEPSNVLLATLENLQPDTVITIEQLWAVFAAFGNVQKIATFEKSAGFQALVQYETSELAKTAKQQLDGRTIPRSILQARTPCQLRIAFSGHRDLNVKYQSHRGRDFTNPDLPWADVDPEIAAKGIQGAISHTPEDGNVLLVQVDEYMYDLTVDNIHEIFKRYGDVKKIAIFQKNNQWQALVQYPDHQSAAAAKQVLEGHAMFEGGANVLRLSYSVHRELNVKNSGEKSRDFSLPLGVPSVGYNHPTSHHHAPQGGFDSHGPRYQHGYADEAQVNGMSYVTAHRAAVERVNMVLRMPPGPGAAAPGRGMAPPAYGPGPGGPAGPGRGGPPPGYAPYGAPPRGGPGGPPPPRPHMYAGGPPPQ